MDGFICGIDPGASGALALLDEKLNLVELDGQIQVLDMPTMPMGKKSKDQVNAAELAKILSNWIDRLGPISIVLEAVHSMPAQGVSSSFNFGLAFGVVWGVAGALQIPVISVTPQSWKKAAGLISMPKDAARTKAQQLYPQAPLGHKKDCGRADAILIGRFSES